MLPVRSVTYVPGLYPLRCSAQSIMAPITGSRLALWAPRFTPRERGSGIGLRTNHARFLNVNRALNVVDEIVGAPI